VSEQKIRVPDLGGIDQVDVVEVLVAAGETVAKDDGLITLESDKASMDVPSPVAGAILELHIARGEKVSEGDLIATVKVEERADGPSTQPERRVEESGERVPRPKPRAPGASSAPLVVLGGGPGGYSAAFRAADLGMDVTLIERHARLGGVCLNVGCIPSKALLHATKVMDEAAAMAEHGIVFDAPKVDLELLREFKNAVVDRLTGGLAQMAKQRHVEIVRGTGTLTSAHSVKIDAEDESRELEFDQLVLAAGSRVARLPDLPYDDPRLIDSTGALELEGIPNKLLVIGGGIIGLEMAAVYAVLGAEITIVELMDGLMPGCDRDLVRPLQKRLEDRLGATIHLQTKVAGLKAQKNGLKATFEGDAAPSPKLFDRALLAVGRRPNSDRIGLEAAGVETDERGFTPVDAQRRTNIAHIFAIGDLTRGPMLAHKASHEGKVAAEVAAGEKSGFDARVIPSVAYTDPEIAWVGLTETEARADGIEYETGVFPWGASGRSLSMGRSDGRTKLLFDPKTRRVIGGGIVGPNAGDLISEVALAIEMGCEAADIGLTIHPHPTLSETVAFAAEVFDGTVTDLYVKRKRR
jgi:dihydrolipoamide dehydrogenase